MADRDEENESSKGFRVVDRRRFTPEGELKADAAPDQPTTPTPSISTPSQPDPGRQPPRGGDPRAAQDPRAAASGRPAQQPDPRRAAPEPDSRRAPPQPEPESGIDFLSFAVSLATNALAALGLLPPEKSQGLPRDPALAREYIDILIMLQHKTRGNLDAREERALAQMVSDLQLQYVEATRPRR